MRNSVLFVLVAAIAVEGFVGWLAIADSRASAQTDVPYSEGEMRQHHAEMHDDSIDEHHQQMHGESFTQHYGTMSGYMQDGGCHS